MCVEIFIAVFRIPFTITKCFYRNRLDRHFQFVKALRRFEFINWILGEKSVFFPFPHAFSQANIRCGERALQPFLSACAETPLSGRSRPRGHVPSGWGCLVSASGLSPVNDALSHTLSRRLFDPAINPSDAKKEKTTT